MSVNEEKIAKFLVENVKPLKDSVYGDYYRASAHLRDGTYLPCVMFGNPTRLIDLAIRRFAATAKMRDGKVFAFGTPFNFEFFDLPAGYTYEDIIEIHSGMIVDENGVEKEFSHDWSRECYRGRPFFHCYTECLPAS